MAREDRLRLFVAAEIPAPARAVLAAAAPGAPWRPVHPDDLHVTLAFLGGRPREEVAAIGAVLADLEGPPVGCELGEGLLLGARGRRVCAVRVHSPGLETVQARLAAALVAGGLYEPEDRPFLPHVTIARSRGRAPRVRPEAVARFEVGGIALFESPPGPAPAGAKAGRYRPILRSTLTG